MDRMTTPIPTRFTDDELAIIDRLVEAGFGESRSAVIRRGVHHLADAARRAQIGAEIAASYRQMPQSAEDDELAMASAIALTEAEPW
jgi:Arc/MetJ-type ribon-helix-helix transcriptional regulator